MTVDVLRMKNTVNNGKSLEIERISKCSQLKVEELFFLIFADDLSVWNRFGGLTTRNWTQISIVVNVWYERIFNIQSLI